MEEVVQSDLNQWSSAPFLKQAVSGLIGFQPRGQTGFSAAEADEADGQELNESLSPTRCVATCKDPFQYHSVSGPVVLVWTVNPATRHFAVLRQHGDVSRWTAHRKQNGNYSPQWSKRVMVHFWGVKMLHSNRLVLLSLWGDSVT